MRPDPRAASPAGPALRCPHCGAGNHAYASFCITCGEPLAAEDLRLPGPAERRSPPRIRLARIGIGLALCAGLVWMLGSWYQDEARAASYRNGAVAVAAHDWAGAIAQFHAAVPYADAATRAVQAEQTLRDQARLAGAAEYASLGRNWLELVPILDKLLQIDPTDAGARSERLFARNMLLDRELQGMIYLIADGPRAGLYATTAAGRDIPLPGSDGRSRTRAWSADGARVVYDRPRAGARITGVREAVLATFRPPTSLAAGVPPDPITTQVLPLIISPSLSGQFVPGGLFWQTFSADDGQPGGSLLFYRFADGQSFPIRASGQWRYLAAASTTTGSTLLVAPPSLNPDPVVSRLTLGHPGDPPLLDQTVTGWMTGASFSPDGQYVLYTMQDGSINTVLSTSLYYIHLQPGAITGTTYVETQFLVSITSAGPNPPLLSAAFVPDGQGASSQALVSLRDQGQQSFSLVRLVDGITTPIWTGPASQRITAQTISEDGAWLAYLAEDADGARLVLQDLRPGMPPLSLGSAGFHQATPSLTFSPGSHYLLYQTPGPTQGTPGALYSLALTPLARAAGGAPPLQPVHLGTVASADDMLPTVALAPGGNVLLYVDPRHTLHAAAYDGTLDLPLDELPGPVAAVWSLQSP
jgi:hypothetical protein